MIGLCEKQIQTPSSPPMQLSNIIHMQIKMTHSARIDKHDAKLIGTQQNMAS